MLIAICKTLSYDAHIYTYILVVCECVFVILEQDVSCRVEAGGEDGGRVCGGGIAC